MNIHFCHNFGDVEGCSGRQQDSQAAGDAAPSVQCVGFTCVGFITIAACGPVGHEQVSRLGEI